MEALKIINTVVAIIFFVCYSYQFIYMAVALFKGKRTKADIRLRNYAVLIAARNEEEVIADLIKSIKDQLYPQKLITVFVVADNCTDNTAAIAEKAGAVVFERNDTSQIGKGYALDFLLKKISSCYPDGTFEGYFVFDADNILEPDYIYEMNRTLSLGYDAVTGYRSSKNFADNWISAGYGIWFLRESQFLNKARYILGTNCNISGTGFVFTDDMLKRIGGWNYYLLTEDLEFTADSILRGEKIGYCERAVLYDEQPTSLKQSVRQRLRWAKGYLQVFGSYGQRLASKTLGGSFSAYDMIMCMTPAYILSVLMTLVNLVGGVYCLASGAGIKELIVGLVGGLFGGYLTFLLVGAATVLTEWQRIDASVGKKLLYTLTFPLFMFTYLPVAIAALFAKPEWKPIEHKRHMEQFAKNSSLRS